MVINNKTLYPKIILLLFITPFNVSYKSISVFFVDFIIKIRATNTRGYF